MSTASFWRSLRPTTRDLPRIAKTLLPIPLLPLIRWRRRRLRDTLVVGVTGSSGKTTAKNLIAGVLRSRRAGRANEGSNNRLWELTRVLMGARSSDRFLVQELGAAGPDTLDAMIWALAPDVGVVLKVAREHWGAFRNLDAIAREKGKILAALPPDGLAVLNADDAAVLAMRESTAARVLLVGLSPSAHLRAEEIECSWPDRLRFVAIHASDRVEVRTRLLGEHFVHAALAALAVGLEAGIPLSEGARALAGVEPERHRLSEVQLPGGITLLEDNVKAAAWSLESAIEVLRRARARRKVVVLGQISDSPLKPSKLYRDAARLCLEVADIVLVVGRWAKYAERARGPGTLYAVDSPRAAHELLERLLTPGDLVLIKSNMLPVHLERLALVRQQIEVKCWRTTCSRPIWCQDCRLRTRPAPRRLEAAPP
jgi:UDP-N-acetylmuramoyl-tripeptide--D-alanyl-D-alanine ligase